MHVKQNWCMQPSEKALLSSFPRQMGQAESGEARPGELLPSRLGENLTRVGVGSRGSSGGVAGHSRSAGMAGRAEHELY